MTNRPILHLAASALLCASSANARAPDLGGGSVIPVPAGAAKPYGPTLKTSVGGDSTSFSADKGWRRTVSAEVSRDFGATAVAFGFGQGERDFGPGKTRHDGIQALARLTHEFGSRVTATTSLGIASNSPVFPRAAFAQDVDVKLGAGTVARLGGRSSRHYGGTVVNAASAGLSQYFGGGFVSYRLSGFRTASKGTTFAHLGSIQLKDPRGSGSTQLWLGAGSSRHDTDWNPEIVEGKFRSVALKRSQPLGGGVGLSLSLGRTSYDRPFKDYRGTKFGIGLNYKR